MKPKQQKFNSFHDLAKLKQFGFNSSEKVISQDEQTRRDLEVDEWGLLAPTEKINWDQVKKCEL